MHQAISTYNLASSANVDFLPGLISLLKSIVFSAPPDAAIHFTVLSDGLPEESIPVLEEAFKIEGSPRSLDIVDMAGQDFSKLNFFGNYTSKAPYFRLSLPDVLKAKDVIYIDSDAIVFEDVTKLFALCRSESQPICAVLNKVIQQLSGDTSWPSLLSKEEELVPYFNSGVMYMDLEHEAFASFQGDINELVEAAERPFAFADQTILNHLFKGNVAYLDERYNMMDCNNRRMLKWNGRGNIHYIGSHKPFLKRGPSLKYFIRNSIFYLFMRDYASLRAAEKEYFSLKSRIYQMRKIGLYGFISSRKYNQRVEDRVSRKEFREFDHRVESEVFGRSEGARQVGDIIFYD